MVGRELRARRNAKQTKRVFENRCGASRLTANAHGAYDIIRMAMKTEGKSKSLKKRRDLRPICKGQIKFREEDLFRDDSDMWEACAQPAKCETGETGSAVVMLEP